MLNHLDVDRHLSRGAKIAVAAMVYDGYRLGTIPWRIAHSALARMSVPNKAITEGLHSNTEFTVPTVILQYIN